MQIIITFRETAYIPLHALDTYKAKHVRFALEGDRTQRCKRFPKNRCKNKASIESLSMIIVYYYPYYHDNEQNSLLNGSRILITINLVTLSVVASAAAPNTYACLAV